MTELLTHFQEDVLADILQSLRMHSTLYCRATMNAPWGFRVSQRSVASFHIVTGGTCWLTLEGIDTPVPLSEGDLVILPHGHAHTMTDHPQTPVTRLEDLVPKQPAGRDGIFYSGGQGTITTLVCGGLQLEDYTTNPLFLILPPFLHIQSRRRESNPWLRAIVQLVKAEASANQPAAEAVITRLSEILFIQAVRTYVSTVGNGETGWFNALKDPQIGQALTLIQHQPEELWTVESLACRVSLSRSAFSAKFKRLVRVIGGWCAISREPPCFMFIVCSLLHQTNGAEALAFTREVADVRSVLLCPTHFRIRKRILQGSQETDSTQSEPPGAFLVGGSAVVLPIQRKVFPEATTDLCVNCPTSVGAVACQKYLAKPGCWDTRAGIRRLTYSSLVMRLKHSVSPCCVSSHASSMLIAMPD